jgi:hypothetical protein
MWCPDRPCLYTSRQWVPDIAFLGLSPIRYDLPNLCLLFRVQLHRVLQRSLLLQLRLLLLCSTIHFCLVGKSNDTAVAYGLMFRKRQEICRVVFCFLPFGVFWARALYSEIGGASNSFAGPQKVFSITRLRITCTHKNIRLHKVAHFGFSNGIPFVIPPIFCSW